jgi:hypothetical protein
MAAVVLDARASAARGLLPAQPQPLQLRNVLVGVEAL